MTADSLIEAVELVIQDNSFSGDLILSFLNKGIREISGVIDLPLLRTSDIVIAGTTANFVSMPDNYQRKCFSVIDVLNGTRIDKPGTLNQYHRFINRNPVPSSTNGFINDVAIKGNTLFFDPIPSTSTELRVEYLRHPNPLVEGSAEPDGIPQHLHESLLVPFAAKEVFNLIEDGLENRKVNFEANMALYQTALGELHSFLGFMDSEPAYIADDYDL